MKSRIQIRIHQNEKLDSDPDPSKWKVGLRSGSIKMKSRIQIRIHVKCLNPLAWLLTNSLYSSFTFLVCIKKALRAVTNTSKLKCKPLIVHLIWAIISFVRTFWNSKILYWTSFRIYNILYIRTCHWGEELNRARCFFKFTNVRSSLDNKNINK